MIGLFRCTRQQDIVPSQVHYSTQPLVAHQLAVAAGRDGGGALVGYSHNRRLCLHEKQSAFLKRTIFDNCSQASDKQLEKKLQSVL